MSSNAIPPSVTPPSPNEWLDTRRDITGISKDVQAIVTSPNHGFTAEDEGVTTVDFLQVHGMIQINGLPGLIQQVLDTNRFTVNINSSNFFTYTSGGIANIVTGIPPSETLGFQTFNTPWQNVA
jgi:hypothetical protein